MGIKVSDLHKNQRTVTEDIKLEGPGGEITTETVTLTYHPSAYTPKRERELNEIQKGDWKSQFILEWLHDMLVSWDVSDDDGVLPTEVEAMAVLPTWFLGEVVQIIANDMGKDRVLSNAG